MAHFYALHQMNISYYGGKSVIVPLALDTFQKMLEASHRAVRKPVPAQVWGLHEASVALVKMSADEAQWYAGLRDWASSWLNNETLPRP